LAELARSLGKGIVCIKSGKTELAQVAAASHTASLAGGGAASSAFLRQVGVAEVNSPAELVETLKVFHVLAGQQGGPRIGPRLCSLSCSGGEAGLVADMSAPFGLEYPAPSDAQRHRLGEILGPIVTIANPLDYHTFIWGDGPRTAEVFATMLAGYDAGLFVIDPPRKDRCDPASYGPALAAIRAAAEATGVPAFPVASLSENFDEAMAEEMIADGIAPLLGLESALGAMKAAQTGPGLAGWRPVVARDGAATRLLSEAEGKALLAAAGIAVPHGVVAPSLAQLAEQVGSLMPPLALKGLGFAHKTEAGAVRLGLTALDGQVEMAGASGYLAEEMVTGVVAEVIVGLQRDPVYGVTLTLGMGGVTAELLADTVTLVAPITATEVADALRRLRLWPLLDGYRGRAKADVAAMVAAVLALQDLMLARPDLAEIEINPLMLRAEGAVAVDALVREELP